ncbi:hypothetical protein [Leisingera sp. ANG59]|uniref:hypothetical protein n=1 Tax=Leisingera sp. ANG59 TaxID=2675221 RepID=UPI00157224C3|nr:hypothetical protein [Leisingera sp. ANG59]NSY39582.1 hypothetical protein [Leisingera sp. ANG59]
MTTKFPDRLSVNIVLPPTVEIGELIEFLSAAYWGKPEIEAREWAAAADLRRDDAPVMAFRKGVPEAGDLDRLGAETFAGGFSIIGDPCGLNVRRIEGADPDRFYDTYGNTSGWRIYDEGAGFLEFQDGFSRQWGLYRGLIEQVLQRFEVLGAHLSRRSRGFAGVSPPHARSDLVMYLANTDLIARDYDTPDAYFETWDSVEYFGAGRALVTRGLETADETEFKRQALEKGIELARAAAPGSTLWETAPYTQEEGDMIFGFEAQLNPVGYFADKKVLEFTASIQGDQLLSPTDVMTLLYYRAFGTSEGEPVEQVLVTFIDKEAAESDARLLRDIKAEVQYYSEAGELRSLN